MFHLGVPKFRNLIMLLTGLWGNGHSHTLLEADTVMQQFYRELFGKIYYMINIISHKFFD